MQQEEKGKKKLERLLDTIKTKGAVDSEGKAKIPLEVFLSDSDSSDSSGDESALSR